MDLCPFKPFHHSMVFFKHKHVLIYYYLARVTKDIHNHIPAVSTNKCHQFPLKHWE